VGPGRWIPHAYGSLTQLELANGQVHVVTLHPLQPGWLVLHRQLHPQVGEQQPVNNSSPGWLAHDAERSTKLWLSSSGTAAAAAAAAGAAAAWSRTPGLQRAGWWSSRRRYRWERESSNPLGLLCNVFWAGSRAAGCCMHLLPFGAQQLRWGLLAASPGSGCTANVFVRRRLRFIETLQSTFTATVQSCTGWRACHHAKAVRLLPMAERSKRSTRSARTLARPSSGWGTWSAAALRPCSKPSPALCSCTGARWVMPGLEG
jgi:hypothetical protein